MADDNFMLKRSEAFVNLLYTILIYKISTSNSL